MPKNTVSDLITDQEMTFAHLILSGTMNDRSAAEAAGLNPDTAAYTKAKPRVRDYMSKHRAAVNEKLVDQEAQGLRKLNLGRDQILKSRIPITDHVCAVLFFRPGPAESSAGHHGVAAGGGRRGFFG